MCPPDIARRIVGRSPARHAQPASWQGDQRATAAPGGGARRDHRLPGLAGPEGPGQRPDPGGGARRAGRGAAPGPRPAGGGRRPARGAAGRAVAPGGPPGRALGPAIRLGVHGPALLGALAPVLGPRRPARPGRPGRLERARAGRRLRADQPAARRRAGAPGQRVAVPADEPEVHQPAVPAGGGHTRVRAAAARPAAADRRPGRPAAGRQLQPRPHRPRRGLGGQAGRTGDRPRLAAGRRARRAAFRRFTVREGQALDDWATWCALAEIHGPDWRTLASGAPVAAVGGGRRGARPAACQGRVPRLAAMGRPGTAGRGAGGGAGGRHEHRRDRRPGGGRAPRRGRRLGVCGRAGPGDERGRAAR